MDGDRTAPNCALLHSSSPLSTVDDDQLSTGANLLKTLQHKYLLFCTVLVLILALTTFTFSGLGFGLCLLLSFTCGILSINALLRYKCKVTIGSVAATVESNRMQSNGAKCSVCFAEMCWRSDHRKMVFSEQQVLISIPAVVDKALEEFLDETLERYIYFWHRGITDDGCLLRELKESMRYLVSVLIRRIQKVDLTRLIIRKLCKAGLSHLDCYLQAGYCNLSRRDSVVVDSVFDYYGSNLHVAAFSRSGELRYLHCLCERLLLVLLPHKFLGCSTVACLIRELFGSSIFLYTMDSLADPDVINNLLIILFDKMPMTVYPDTTEATVILLENFVKTVSLQSRTKLGREVCCPTARQTHLYPFMTFLKNENRVGLLQFYLALEDFKDKLLNPDLNDKEIRHLHRELGKLYELYMAPNGIDKLGFDKEIVDQFRNVAEGCYEGVVKLRTLPSLYEAHEYVCILLDRNVPLFRRSDEYFEHLCGSRMRKLSSKPINKSFQKRTNLSTAAKIGSKINRIRGVLMPVSAIDGQLEEDDDDDDDEEEELAPELAEAGFEADELKLDDEPSSGRDLSAWRVSIPRLDGRTDGKPYFVYVIDVQRIDVTKKENPDRCHWVVERRYHEFYVLESKLAEFHGENMDTHLPVKKSFGSKGSEFLESRRAAFEEFLQRLLQKPVFRGSELLFTFLTSTGDFTTSLLPDINLGRMIKNVPMRLVKERGQHLDSFVHNFVASTEVPPKMKSTKTEFRDVKDLYPPSIVSQRLQKSIYGDNAGKKSNQASVVFPRSKSVLPVHNFTDYVLYICVKVMLVPRWTLNILSVLLKCFAPLSNYFVENYLNVRLEQALVPRRIAVLVYSLKDIVFPAESVTRRTEVEKESRAREALSKARAYLPRLLVSIVGRERHDDCFAKLFQLLQHPRLNKQLLYTLLDTVVVELFPELGEARSFAAGDQKPVQNGKVDNDAVS